MAKLTGISAWNTGFGSDTWSLRVEFMDELQNHQISVFPGDTHIELAERLHSLAEAIKNNPKLNQQNDKGEATERTA